MSLCSFSRVISGCFMNCFLRPGHHFLSGLKIISLKITDSVQIKIFSVFIIHKYAFSPLASMIFSSDFLEEDVKLFPKPLHCCGLPCHFCLKICLFVPSLFLPEQAELSNLNSFPNKPWFLRVSNTNLLKTLWEKEKLLVTSYFSFSNSVFYPSKELSAIFINLKIVVCKPFQFGRV